MTRDADPGDGPGQHRERGDVFATRDAKLVLQDGWPAQNRHGHRPFELVAVLDGPIDLEIDDAAPLRATCFLVPPMRRHAFAGYAGRVARIYFDPGYHRFASWKDQPVRCDMPGRHDLLARIAAFHGSERPAAEAGRLVEAWLDRWIEVPDAPAPCDPRIVAALRHLDEQATSPRADRARVAKLVGLSPTRFAALFAENTGMSLSRYLIWRRVKIAMTLICAGETVTGAAAFAGFSDCAHLTRSCRQTYGCAPSSISGLKVHHAVSDASPGPSDTHLCLAPQVKRALRDRAPT